VAVVVARAYLNNAAGRLNPAQESWAGSGGAAVVADLQDTAIQVVSGGEKAVLGLEAGIAHEQEGDLVAGDFEDDRIFVEVVKGGRSWREDLDLEAGVEIDGLAISATL
jgi:hypothetical protein